VEKLKPLRCVSQFVLFWLGQLSPLLIVVWALYSVGKLGWWAIHFDWIGHQNNVKVTCAALMVTTLALVPVFYISQRLKNTAWHGFFLVLLLIPAAIILCIALQPLELGK